jgi:hypothetical protein
VAIERKGTIAETAREYAFEAIASLVTTMRDPFAKAARRDRARFAASQRVSNHSITSSAMASMPGGMVRPSVLAVRRLMTKQHK